MPKSFSFKDTRLVLDKIDAVTSGLAKRAEFPKRKAREIQAVFADLSRSAFLSDIYVHDLKKEPSSINNPQFSALLVLLYQYKLGVEPSKYCNDLLLKIYNDIGTYPHLLTSGNNAIKWLFCSSEKKEQIEEAFHFLSEFADSDLVFEAQTAIKSFDSHFDIDSTAAEEDFDLDKASYELLVESLCSFKDGKSIPFFITKLLQKNSSIDGKYASIKDEDDKRTKRIKEVLFDLVNREAMRVLRNADVEELNRNKQGIRVKLLRKAGYNTIADIVSASVYNLAAIEGISYNKANTIKHVAYNMSKDAAASIRIKLSVDDRNDLSTAIVKSLAAYRPLADQKNKLDTLRSSVSNQIDNAKSLINREQSGRFWIFRSDEYKRSFKEAFDNFCEIVDGDYLTVTENTLKSYKNVVPRLTDDEAWNDFNSNSIQYYNIIEQICPGLLGGAGSVYGLPEEIAREIQDECIYPDGLTCSLRRYQEWGVKFILHQEKVLLGDEMGLGKTVQAIAAMVSLKNTGATHFLVICPASVVVNWCREIINHSKLKPIMGHGAYKVSAIQSWLRSGGVCVTTFESARLINLPDSFRYDLLVVDEAHYIKNRGAQRTEKAVELSKCANRILFMTGTALENKVDEMISLIRVLNPNVASKASYAAFMSAAPEFRRLVAPVYYRRKREDVLAELPDKIETDEWCTMSPAEEAQYESNILSRNFMAARRLSWDVNDLNTSSKMTRLREIIEDASREGRKILVFSFFLDTINKIIDHLGSVCLGPINGSVSPQRRLQIIDEFNAAPPGTVLCSQITSGGVGLNIQAASVVIICEPQLKPSIETQAISRSYRMGQARNVQVFRLLCVNSIDERIHNLLKEKQQIFDAFADKSVAAESFELDSDTISDIISKEIERITLKNSKITSASIPDDDTADTVAYDDDDLWSDIQGLLEHDIDILGDFVNGITTLHEDTKGYDEASFADEYSNTPVSVTTRIKEVPQPYGGYINPKLLLKTELTSDNELASNENIPASLIGLAVDYLTRFMLEKKPEKAFDISLKGSRIVEETSLSYKLLRRIKGLDDESISAAVKLVGFDCAYRVGASVYKPVSDIRPDNKTISNIREMVNRSLLFFKKYGPVVKYGVTFEGGGYSKVVVSGDGDFMTGDTLWDFKVSKNPPTNTNTYQLLVYYVMGLHSKYTEFKNLRYIGIFNPRANMVYQYPVSKISNDTIRTIETKVICY